jgi:hypothetical protein
LATDEALRAIHTTRTRLLAEKSPFTLERDSSISSPIKTSTLNVQRSINNIVLENASRLDYWEVDPDWDGKTFKSAAQASRPVRSGYIPSELKIKIGRRACVRWVTVNGRQYQMELDI